MKLVHTRNKKMNEWGTRLSLRNELKISAFQLAFIYLFIGCIIVVFLNFWGVKRNGDESNVQAQ